MVNNLIEILLRMVFSEDRDGVIDASIDKIRNLVKAHVADSAKIHPSFKNSLLKCRMRLPLLVHGRILVIVSIFAKPYTFNIVIVF
jgi:hypothetical protein